MGAEDNEERLGPAETTFLQSLKFDYFENYNKNNVNKWVKDDVLPTFDSAFKQEEGVSRQATHKVR